MVEFSGLKNPSLKTLPVEIKYSESLMDWDDLMVSMATVEFKQKQQRTDNKFVLLRSPITCSELLVCENAQHVVMFIYYKLWFWFEVFLDRRQLKTFKSLRRQLWHKWSKFSKLTHKSTCSTTKFSSIWIWHHNS